MDHVHENHGGGADRQAHDEPDPAALVSPAIGATGDETAALPATAVTMAAAAMPATAMPATAAAAVVQG